jgi:hypothetical protein
VVSRSTTDILVKDALSYAGEFRSLSESQTRRQLPLYWIPEQDRWSSPTGSEFPKRSGTRYTTYMRH